MDKQSVTDRFLRYIAVDTQSAEDSDTFPSTEKQKNLGRMLAEELRSMGADRVVFDDRYGYVYAMIPATDAGNKETLGLIAHMDTAPETSGKNVKPHFVENYQGQDIVLNEEQHIVLSPKVYPEMNHYTGKTLIVTDGTTLLGGDDKAGVAEIMTLADTLLSDPSIPHGRIAIAFTPDEEVGCGVDHFDTEQFGADYAFTVDGGAIGELEYENFNAASADVTVYGVTVHPGEAKGKMKNASLIAMEFAGMMPEEQRPECTEGYEGFLHLSDMSGKVEEARLSYIIRDHDRSEFEQKKELFHQAARELNQKYGENTVTVDIRDSYYNMKEKIEPDYMFLIERAKTAMEKVGIVPKIQPIRGGTDGARLSFMGLPCPNLCAGGHNFHGRYEYICKESMETIVRMLIELSKTV